MLEAKWCVQEWADEELKSWKELPVFVNERMIKVQGQSMGHEYADSPLSSFVE